jgi:predicted metal-binding transcription factor (methanogenesis marker protein 9)
MLSLILVELAEPELSAQAYYRAAASFVRRGAARATGSSECFGQHVLCGGSKK